MDVFDVVTLLAAAVSAIAAAVGAWVGYLQYRDRHAPARPASPEPQPSPPETPEVDSAPRNDQWNVDWTSEKLASRAAVAMSAGAVSCLCLATMLLTGVIIDADGSVDGAAATVLQLAMVIGIVAIVVATLMAMRVRRAARGRFRRPWRNATLALWLAWAPWVAGYLPLVALY